MPEAHEECLELIPVEADVEAAREQLKGTGASSDV